MAKELLPNSCILLEKVKIMFAIKDVGDASARLAVLPSVFHFVDCFDVEEEIEKARNKWKILEDISWSALRVVTWFVTVRALIKMGELARETAARIDAAVIVDRLDANEETDTALANE